MSELHWSPAGRNILLAGLSSTQGTLEFFNVDDMATLRLQAHFMCNNVLWDKSGRFVCSWVDVSRDMDHGYVMWSFTGEMLYRCVLMLLSAWFSYSILFAEFLDADNASHVRQGIVRPVVAACSVASYLGINMLFTTH